MCDKCNGQLNLISYKWNNDEIIYKYKCSKCDDIITVNSELEENTLKDMIDNSDLYSKYNL